jgi:hypothetical protein
MRGSALLDACTVWHSPPVVKDYACPFAFGRTAGLQRSARPAEEIAGLPEGHCLSDLGLPLSRAEVTEHQRQLDGRLALREVDRGRAQTDGGRAGR